MQWHPGTVAEHAQDGSNLATVEFDLGFSAAGVFGPAFFDAAPGVAGVGSDYAYKWLDTGAGASESSQASQEDAEGEEQPRSEGADQQGGPESAPGSPADGSNGEQEPGVGLKSAGKASSGASQPVKRYSLSNFPHEFFAVFSA